MFRFYSKGTKEEAVKRYNKGEPINSISRGLGVSRDQVLVWIERSRRGIGFGPGSRKKRVPGWVKLRAVEEVVKEGRWEREVALDYDVHRVSLGKWRRLYERCGAEAFEGPERAGNVEAGEYTIKRGKSYIKIKRGIKKNASKEEVVAGIKKLKMEYKLKVLLADAKISRGSYYYQLRKLKQGDKYKLERKRIKELHKEHKGRYGYRRITELLHGEGFKINHKTVLKVMKAEGLKYVGKKVKYKSYRGEVGKRADNLIKRDFKANKPNEKWLTDVTEIKVKKRKCYLSPIVDVFNGEIVSYDISDHADLNMIDRMLKRAYKAIDNKTEGIILHSDQGWQYQQYRYYNQLEEHGMLMSMSRKGNCYDNAKMESFFGHMKQELLYAQEFKNIEEFKKELRAYIDYYNTTRLKSDIGYVPPVLYRLRWQQQQHNM